LLFYGGILKRSFEILEEGFHLLPDCDPVDPEHHRDQGGGEDDQDAQQGAGDCVVGGCCMISQDFDRAAVQLFHIDNPQPCVICWEPVIAAHLLLVHQARLGHLQPVVEGVHVAVAGEGVAMEINLTNFVALVAEHQVKLVQGVLPQVPDLVVFKVEVSQLLETAQGEVDVRELVITEVEIQKFWQLAEHVVILDLPDLILFKVELFQLLQL